MSEPAVEVSAYRFALYSGAERLGLAAERGQAVALFADEATARAHGRRLYGEFAEVVELGEAGDSRS